MHSVRFRIALAFGVCLAITIIVGGAGAVGMSGMAADMRGIYRNNTVPIIQLLSMTAAESDIRRQLRRMQVERDVSKSRELAAELQATRQEMDRQWAAYYPDGITSDSEREIAGKIAELYPRYKTAIDRAAAALQTGDFDAARTVVDASLPIAGQMHVELARDVKDNIAQAEAAIAGGERNYRRLLLGVLGACALGLLFIVAINFYLFRVISRPLDDAVHHMRRIATGDLGAPIDVRSRDEFAHLLHALNGMSGQLRGIVGRIQGASDAIATSSVQISGGNADLADRTRLQSASIEEARASLGGLLKTVEDNVGSAHEANRLATGAADMARRNSEAVMRMLATMNDIRGSSGKIADITSLIESIAFQTNILALNAAVEAARAGEQGRGFAVVASEVRNLAQRSSAAAKEIKELIEVSVSTIQHGVDQAQEVGDSVTEMQQAIQRVAGINVEIASASEEQQRGIGMVVGEVTQIEQLAQQNVGLVTEVADVTRALAERAAMQRQEVSVFRLA